VTATPRDNASIREVVDRHELEIDHRSIPALIERLWRA
jgi:hypothetical protein